MQDFLKAQLALFASCSATWSCRAALWALMLASTIQGSLFITSWLCSKSIVALRLGFALALLRRLALVGRANLVGRDGDIDFDEPDDKGFDWPGQIAAAIILFISAMGFAYWEDHAETVFHSLKPHIGESMGCYACRPRRLLCLAFFRRGFDADLRLSHGPGQT